MSERLVGRKALLCGGPASGELVDDNRVLPPGDPDVILVMKYPPVWWEDLDAPVRVARYRRAEHGQYVFEGWEGDR